MATEPKAYYTAAEVKGMLSMIAKATGYSLGALHGLLRDIDSGILPTCRLEKAKNSYREAIKTMQELFGPAYEQQIAEMNLPEDKEKN